MLELNENDFAGRTSKGVVLIEFGAEWCGPCKTMLPILERVAQSYGGRMQIFSIDIDRSPMVAAKSGVMSVPTMLVFKDGKQVERMVGVVSERDLRKRLDPYLGGA